MILECRKTGHKNCSDGSDINTLINMYQYASRTDRYSRGYLTLIHNGKPVDVRPSAHGQQKDRRNGTDRPQRKYVQERVFQPLRGSFRTFQA